MSAVPIRVRRVVESRDEHALCLPAGIPEVSELLDTARAALLTDGRPVDEATVREHEGALVISYETKPDTDQASSARPALGFVA